MGPLGRSGMTCEREREELRALIREAHETIKDLRCECAAWDRHRAAVADELDSLFARRAVPLIEAGLKEFTRVTIEASLQSIADEKAHIADAFSAKGWDLRRLSDAVTLTAQRYSEILEWATAVNKVLQRSEGVRFR